jgi:hypothetical protein
MQEKVVPVAYHYHEEWKPLVGRWVQIRLRGDLVDQGVIDDVTMDDNILWLQAGGGQDRRLILRDDRFQVWINYSWESPGSENLK